MEEGKKKCSRCQEVKSLEEFHNKKSARDQRQSQCKDCKREISGSKTKRERQQGFKLCRGCNQLLPRESFHRQGKYLKSKCRQCRAAENAENREQRRAYNQQYRIKNRDWLLGRMKGYYAANRSRILDYKKQYNANNKEKVREWWRKREALKREALYLGHTVEDLEQKLAFYGGKCWICKTNPHEHWDHVKPLSKGGAHILANLRPSCASCNRSKRDRWPFVPEMILDNQRAYALAT